MSTTTNTAALYTDFASLGQLRAQAREHPQAALREVAQQFEAIFLQMMLKHMRDANRTLSSDFSNSDHVAFYQEMQDNQLATSMRGSLGLADILVRQLQPTAGVNANDKQMHPLVFGMQDKQATHLLNTSNMLATAKQNAPVDLLNSISNAFNFNSKKDFVMQLWDYAKKTAATLGVDPRVLIAQAALETNWGKKIIGHAAGSPSFNLFNIKADPSWEKNKVVVPTLEYKNGVAVRQHAAFRSYGSYADSFEDYANFLLRNPRYHTALTNAANPHDFTKELQKAGYATDPNYANKINQIMQDNVMSGF